MEIIQKILLVFTIIGALNWGLVGIFDLNLVSLLFGKESIISMIIYIIIGICGLCNIGILFYHFNQSK